MLVGMTGSLYFLGALILGRALLLCRLGLGLFGSPAAARRLMFATLLCLPALFTPLAVDKIAF